MGGVMGAAHCVDVPFAFDNLDAPGAEVALGPEPPQALADHMHRAWVDFVTEGDPGWPAFRVDTRPAMVSTARAPWSMTPCAFRAPCGEPRNRLGVEFILGRQRS
jgi:carboxylesterase type B